MCVLLDTATYYIKQNHLLSRCILQDIKNILPLLAGTRILCLTVTNAFHKFQESCLPGGILLSTVEAVAVKAAADLGPLFLDGLADGIRIDAPHLSEKEIAEIELMILQAARVRMSRTEYIACPSCGRTLYDIEGTLAAIRARTSHLKNLKIGVMGCIVNGPGEMADADYGYVGAAPGRITLYKGRTVVEKNIPQEEALDRLVALIKANGDWADPENQPERP